MANTHATLTDLFSAIADAIRSKTGETGSLVADNFPALIEAIATGVDLKDLFGLTKIAVDTFTLSSALSLSSSNKELTTHSLGEVPKIAILLSDLSNVDTSLNKCLIAMFGATQAASANSTAYIAYEVYCSSGNRSAATSGVSTTWSATAINIKSASTTTITTVPAGREYTLITLA